MSASGVMTSSCVDVRVGGEAIERRLENARDARTGVRKHVDRVLGAASYTCFSFCHVGSLPVEAAVARRE